jgi:hypothetical protein
LSIGAKMSGQNGGLAKPPFCPWKHYLMDKTLFLYHHPTPFFAPFFLTFSCYRDVKLSYSSHHPSPTPTNHHHHQPPFRLSPPLRNCYRAVDWIITFKQRPFSMSRTPFQNKDLCFTVQTTKVNMSRTRWTQCRTTLMRSLFVLMTVSPGTCCSSSTLLAPSVMRSSQR